MENIRDDFKEHELHKSPYWQNMKTCSECYRIHEEIKHKFNCRVISDRDWQGREAMDNHILGVR